MRAQYFRGNLFVANLPPDLTEDELAEAFDPFGIVLSAFIARDPDSGKRLRYGFVDIATEKAAKAAVEAMNGADLAGHTLDVRISDRRKETKGRKPAQPRPAARRSTARPAARSAAADDYPAAASLLSAGHGAEDGEAGYAARPTLRRAPADGDAAPAPFTPRPAPRRQPSFQVERRPLPRRI
jgi:RNA recognition motif-containing protein